MNINTKTLTKTYSGKYLPDYDRDFLQWSQSYLPEARRFFIQDVDALIRDRSNNIRFLEIKRKGYLPKAYQLRTMLIIDQVFKRFMENTTGRVTINFRGNIERHKINYHGYNLLQLPGVSFSDGQFLFDGRPVSSQELVKILSF